MSHHGNEGARPVAGAVSAVRERIRASTPEYDRLEQEKAVAFHDRPDRAIPIHA
jgi:hypothetical protein